MLSALKQFFRPRFVIETAHTAHGPAIDVKRCVLGFRFRVGEDTFAKVASAYIDAIPGWRLAPPQLRLAGGAVRPHVRPKLAPTRAPAVAPRRAKAQPAAAQAVAAAPARITSPTSSAAWAQRCDTMAMNREWGSTPEVQAAAHLYGSRIRVFTPDANGRHTLRFVANADETQKSLDLILSDHHYNWVSGGVSGDTLTSEDASRVRVVTGDGNCLFRCFADGLEGGPVDHTTARREIVGYLRERENMPLDGSFGMTTLGDV